MTAPAPIAVGYLAASDDEARVRQEEAVANYARVEGYTLAHLLPDDRDALTIAQVVEAARYHGANVVLVPADATLATASQGLGQQLALHGAVCVVVGAARAGTADRVLQGQAGQAQSPALYELPVMGP